MYHPKKLAQPLAPLPLVSFQIGSSCPFIFTTFPNFETRGKVEYRPDDHKTDILFNSSLLTVSPAGNDDVNCWQNHPKHSARPAAKTKQNKTKQNKTFCSSSLPHQERE